LAGHPIFGGYLFSSSASVNDAKQNKNQSPESEEMRSDTTNVQRTTGAKTKLLSLVSMIADDVCPWPPWYLSRRVKATPSPSNDTRARRRFILTLPATRRRKPEDRSQKMTAQSSSASSKEAIWSSVTYHYCGYLRSPFEPNVGGMVVDHKNDSLLQQTADFYWSRRDQASGLRSISTIHSFFATDSVESSLE